MSDKDSERTDRNDGRLPSLTALAEAFGTALGGASRLTRERARQLAERLLSQAGLENVDLGEAASGASARINQLTEEILAARKANRALLQRTVAGELEKSLDRVGLARAEEVAALREDVASLRNEISRLSELSAADSTTAAPRAAAKAPGQRTAKKTATKKSAAKATAAKKAPAKKTAKKATSSRAAKKSSTGAGE